MARRLRLASEGVSEEKEPEAPPIEDCSNLRCRRRQMCLRRARGAACAVPGLQASALREELLAWARKVVRDYRKGGIAAVTRPVSEQTRRSRRRRDVRDGTHALRAELGERFLHMAWQEAEEEEMRARRADGVYEAHALEHELGQYELGQGETAGVFAPESALEPDSPAGPALAPPPKREPAVPRIVDLSSPPLVPFHRLT